MKNIYQEISKSLNLQTPPSYEYLYSLLDRVTDILDSEDKSYRPEASDESLGAMLDFSNEKSLPTIIIPDIHARTNFIKNILNYTITPEHNFLKTKKNISIYKALKQNKIRIICVGDALHTEATTIERWQYAQMEYFENIFTGPSITAEAKDCFSTLCALLLLKINFPQNFHFLKGNHENIYNITENGDFAFKKIADEGQMIKKFVQNFYGDDILYLISFYEHKLPLIAVTKECVVSHAEPRRAYKKQELINGLSTPQIIEDLTWTSNGEAEENSVIDIISNLLSEKSNAIYFAGHRPVKEDYNSLYNNRFYQIHNPRKQNIVLVPNKRAFNPETDIIGVEK